MKGLGKDMMKVGESLSRTAEKVQINHINQRNQQQQQTVPSQNQNQVIYSQHPTYTAPSYPQQNAPQQQGYPSYQ